MRMKILFGAVTLAVLVGGTMVRGHVWSVSQTGPSRAYAPQGSGQTTYATPQPAENYAEPPSSQATAPAQAGNYAELAPSRQSAAPAQTMSPVSEPAPHPVRRHRSLGRQAMIIGGSAAAGTAIGAAAGGGKGAAVGAVSGGVAGLVYDLLTKNR